MPERPYIILVSGLPRSGTSMMMRMLEAGGVPVLADQTRQADEDNPRGYYELEAVKKSRADSSWAHEARGKAVKIVYRLLYHLPADLEYRVLFMNRELREVLASQNAMLKRSGGDSGDMSEAEFTKIFSEECRRAKQWLCEQPNFRLLEVDYNAMLASPAVQIAAVDEFLDGTLDRAAMQRVVEPGLYRQRG